VSPAEVIPASGWEDRARSLEAEGWWLAALCGVDRLSLPGDHRFEVVVQLLHHERKQREMVHIAAQGDPPTVPSVTSLWPSATNMEREVFDMFGVRFEGHPNLTRILMPDEWEGHPLRKDYGVGKVPVEFIPQPLLQIDAPGQAPAGEAAGRQVDALGQAGPPQRYDPERDGAGTR
jgi:NADH-quinone oxidoreductase subunit C